MKVEVIDKRKKEERWFGCDLDATLAHYDGWKGIEHIGKPIPKMVEKMMKKIESSMKVKIFTARAGEPKAIPYIKQWLKDNNLPDLEITNVKDYMCEEIWDDRARGVKANTGEFLCNEE